MNDDQSNNEDQPAESEAELLAALRGSLGPDIPPAGLVDRAVGLIAFADVDRQLDELLREAATDVVGVRGPADDERRLFEVADGSVACEITIDDGRLDGQVLSGRVTSVGLAGVTGPAIVAPVDELGRFTFQHFTAGPSRLRLDDGSGRDLVTDWFLL